MTWPFCFREGVMLYVVAPDYAIFRQVKYGEERFWWQDREIFNLSYHRGERLYCYYLVHHPVTGVQIGFVKWWYSNHVQEKFENESYNGAGADMLYNER